MITIAELPVEHRLRVEALDRGCSAVLPEHDVVVTRGESGLLHVECIKCWGHRMEAELQPPEDFLPKYSHQFTHPLKIVKWNTAKAWRLVRQSRRVPRPIDPEWLAIWIRDRSNLVRDHQDHIPAEHLRAPLLLDTVWAECHRKETGAWMSAPFSLLLDGHHRAARAVREGWIATGFFLTAEEHEQVTSEQAGAYDPELCGWRTLEEVLADGGIDFDSRVTPLGRIS